MDPKNAFRYAWQPYVVAIALVAAAAALRLWPLQALGVRLAWLTFYPAVMVAALYGGFSAGLLGTFLSCLTVLFLLPVIIDQPFIRDSADWLGTAVFFITCTMISGVAEAMRRAQARAKQANEQLEAANIKLQEEITERKRAEEELFRQTSILKSVLTSIGDGVVVADLDGKFLIWNPAAEQIISLGPMDVPPEQWSERYGVYLPDQVTPYPPDRLPLARAIRGEAVDGDEQFLRHAKAPQGVWLSVTGRPLIDESGILRGGVVVFNNITERKRVEEETRKLNEQLEAVNKELEAFSYSVSHDLRAPLRHINGFVELLKEHLAAHLDPKGRRYMDTITDSATQMGRLIDDLLVFSRMGKVEMRLSKINLDSLVRETLENLQAETQGRKITWKIGKLTEVYGDAAMLRQVWINLIGNAVKYTRTCERADIEIGSTSDGKEYVFFVKDNGVGFDPQYAGKLFGVFQRLHSSDEFEGTGIGLANVRRIIHRHGGRTWAEGRVDGGAVFYFSLPNKKEGQDG